MNPYAFLAKLAGIGLVAGTAVAMVKLVEKVWPKPGAGDGTFEYIAMAGEFPPEDEEACADGRATGEGAASETADRTAGLDTENDTANCAAAPDTPNANPVDAPPAVPVTDPLKIADPADFQDWDGLGCQG